MISRIFDYFFSLFLALIVLPFVPFLYLVVKFSSNGPFIYKQKRMGRDRKIFYIYKIRTMREGAEELKKKYQKYNEADGPVFKIRDDPRFTKVGRWLAKFGLDELPQLINVLKGEMSLVGPRPLPIDEAVKVPKKYMKRFSGLPGMTSPWVVKGAHNLSFEKWMKLDMEYIRKKSVYLDLRILWETFITLLNLLLNCTYQVVRKSIARS